MVESGPCQRRNRLESTGYTNVLRVLKKAETEEDNDLRDWVSPYDPEHFDLEAVNRRLQPRRAKDRVRG